MGTGTAHGGHALDLEDPLHRAGLASREDAGPPARMDRLRHAVDHAAHLLPAQGPITVFIHHNTLHAFEHMPFHEGICAGARLFGCEPYLTEDRYRDALRRGRIRFRDLREVLRDDLGGRADEVVLRPVTRLELRLAMLQDPLRAGPAEELEWFAAEADAMRKVRPDASAAARTRFVAETRRWVMRDLRGRASAPEGLRQLLAEFGEARIETWSDATWEAFAVRALWQVCHDGYAALPATAAPAVTPARHRDLLQAATGFDIDPPVNDLMTRFCAAFLDQGLSHWPLPDRERGFYASFLTLYSRPGGPPDRWLAGLRGELARQAAAGFGPLESAADSLEQLGVPESEWEEYTAAALLALRGWAGMVRQVEERGDRVAHPIPGDSLAGFLAIRLILERLALAHAAADHIGYRGPLSGLRAELVRRAPPPARPATGTRAFALFQLAQVLGWSPGDLARLDAAGWATLVAEVEGFDSLERRRVFHLAYERRFREQTLDALVLHRPEPGPPRPRFQVVACLDEREESFRRHLEEIAPDCETFGTAGFFAVPMYYRGAADAHFVPLCPIVMRPKHWVTEQCVEGHEDDHERRARARKVLGTATHHFHIGTRTFAVGAVLSAGLGVLASIPLVARILFPRLTARVRRALGRVVEPPPATRLVLERSHEEPGPENGHVGFTVDEMAGMGERLLRDIGLTSNFARLVFIVGHGSVSLNNPHKSAYDCGACGGSPGAPNGRALAHLLNDPRVRRVLAERGIAVPDETVFVGGFHNTCNDSVTLADTERVPETHRGDLDAARTDFEKACARNAHERCRRFMSAPLTQPTEQARQHVEARSEDLAQTRPELGHATNAICVVGRRPRTRGLYLDRRAFLASYDPTQDDDEGTILTRSLLPVFPVCGGINLEYYFSHVDSPGYGCGTKLPHNITSLLGVMDGAASDLRTGLPWQMVEIHEPVRLLVVVESTPEMLLKIMARNEPIDRLVRHGWVQLAVLDPYSPLVRVYRDGKFEDYRPGAEALPRAESSFAWYRGWRDHLEFAEIGGGS
jgi:uncharacterized protein YbcC (UPF0753/DUF2309 family)